MKAYVPYQKSGQGYPPPSPPPDQRIMLELDRSRRDVSELQVLARKLNTKLETEMKRTRQLQEEIVLANVNMRNMILQNEDLRERLQHIESYGVEQKHVHVVKEQKSPAELALILVGMCAVIGMFLVMTFAVAVTVS